MRGDKRQNSESEILEIASDKNQNGTARISMIQQLSKEDKQTQDVPKRSTSINTD